jgi:hypothetical protein
VRVVDDELEIVVVDEVEAADGSENSRGQGDE